MADFYVNLPVISSLSNEQRSAIMLTSAVALSDGVKIDNLIVLIFRHLNNVCTNKKSILISNNKFTRLFLNQFCKHKSINLTKNIISSKLFLKINKETYYDEILIDEIEKISLQELTYFKQITQNISFTNYDLNENIISQIFVNNINFKFFNKILNTPREKPVFIDVENNFSLKKNTIDIIRTWTSEIHNIGICIKSKKNLNSVTNELKKNKIDLSQSNSKRLKNIHILTFKDLNKYVFHFDTLVFCFFTNKINFNSDEIINIFEIASSKAKHNIFCISNKNYIFSKN